MASRSAAVTNKDISQIIKQAVPEIHREGDKSRFECLTGKALSVWLALSMKPVKEFFVYKMQIKLKSCVTLFSGIVHK